MKYFIMTLILVNILPASEIRSPKLHGRSEDYIDDGQMCDLPHRPLASRHRNAVLVDSSGRAFSAWTNIHECLAFNPIVGGLEFVCRGYSQLFDLYTHQTPKDFSFWVHDYVYDNYLYGSAHYPTSLASSSGPHIGFPVVPPIGLWGDMCGAYESGGWFSSSWNPAVDFSGDVGAHKNVAKELPTGDIVFLADLYYDHAIRYETWTADLSMQQAAGVFGTNVDYWGADCNGGICYLFYYDVATLDIYYRTTTDGITWTPEAAWDITWPVPFFNNVLYAATNKQMALTDAGDPILVFTLWDGDDATYPFSSKTYVQTASGATPKQVSDDTYEASWYPTIATGGNYVLVLMHVWTNTEEDSFARHDMCHAWSDDNGATWSSFVYNNTAAEPNRPGLAQLAKRVDATNGNFFFFYGICMTVDQDPNYSLIFNTDHAFEPHAWYVAWAPIVGIEEDKQIPIPQKLQLEIYPNPFSNKTDIRFMIHDDDNVNIKIYDATGRLVRQYNQLTNHQSLINQITWQGDDDFGRRVSAGVYFVQLKDGKISVGRKIIKLE